MTLRGLVRNEGKGHRLIPAAKVGVGPELALEVDPELTLEVSLELTLEVRLEIVLEPIVKVALMVTYRGMYPWSPNQPPPRRRVTFNDPKDEKDPAREEVGCSTEPSIGDLETW